MGASAKIHPGSRLSRRADRFSGSGQLTSAQLDSARPSPRFPTRLPLRPPERISLPPPSVQFFLIDASFKSQSRNLHNSPLFSGPKSPTRLRTHLSMPRLIITPLLTVPLILYLTPSPYLRFLSVTGILFLTGWSWLEREGHRIEAEAENLRRIRSKVVDEQHSGSTGLSVNLGGKGGLKRATTWRELIEEEEEVEEDEEEAEEEEAEGEVLEGGGEESEEGNWRAQRGN